MDNEQFTTTAGETQENAAVDETPAAEPETAAEEIKEPEETGYAQPEEGAQNAPTESESAEEESAEEEPAEDESAKEASAEGEAAEAMPAESVPDGGAPAADKQKRPSRAPIVALAIATVVLAAVVAALLLIVLSLTKNVNALKAAEKTKTTEQPQVTYQPIVLPDAGGVSANAAVINVASVCSPSVVTVDVTLADGTGSGSGVVYTEDGYIITNNHVVEDAVSVKVTFISGEAYLATVVGTDPDTDLALLRIHASGLIPAKLGNSDDILVGELAVAIGNPLGTLANTVTDGVVSALARNIKVDGTVYHVMQISCAINPGNSGGGCFNANGELIGIVNAKKQQSGIEGLGFAIPVNTVKKVIAEMAENDKTEWRKSLGITGSLEINAENYASFKESESALENYEAANGGEPLYGIYILSDGNVEYADVKNTLQNGDVLLTFDGKKVTSREELNALLEEKEEGDIVTLTVYRLTYSGSRWSRTATLVEREIQIKIVMMYR